MDNPVDIQHLTFMSSQEKEQRKQRGGNFQMVRKE